MNQPNQPIPNPEDKLQTQKAFLTEYFKQLREEMHLRLNKNYNLIIYKLVSLATVCSFLIVNNDKISKIVNATYMIYILLPLLAITFDIQIANNMKKLNTTGTFIRDKIESFFKDNYELDLYEIQSLDFSAKASRVVEIVITLFVLVFCGFIIIPSELIIGLKILIGITILPLFVYSSWFLIDSLKGHEFL